VANNSPVVTSRNKDYPAACRWAKAKAGSKLSSRSPVANLVCRAACPVSPYPTSPAAIPDKQEDSQAKGKGNWDGNRSFPAQAADLCSPVVNRADPAAFLLEKDAGANKGCSPSRAVLAEAACRSFPAENRDLSAASPKAGAKRANENLLLCASSTLRLNRTPHFVRVARLPFPAPRRSLLPLQSDYILGPAVEWVRLPRS
jgi:hypothetical protein